MILQCTREDFTTSLEFDLESFLHFLISIRKIFFWIVVPNKEEVGKLDYFVRYIKNNSPCFPKITEVEEDIESILDMNMEIGEKVHLK